MHFFEAVGMQNGAQQLAFRSHEFVSQMKLLTNSFGSQSWGLNSAGRGTRETALFVPVCQVLYLQFHDDEGGMVAVW